MVPGRSVGSALWAVCRWVGAEGRPRFQQVSAGTVDSFLMSEAGSLLLYRQPESLGASRDLDLAIELLRGTRRYAQDPHDPLATGPILRIYQPLPTVAFGQRDQKLPGFRRAVEACADNGFAPLVRRAGGRAAAYHGGSLVIDHIEPDPDPIRESQDRFRAFGALFVEALQRCGVDALLGPIPAEYCYGEHSVHAVMPGEPDVRIKLVGTAQRQVGSGWLFSTSVVVEDGAPIRRVLTEAYDALGLEWDPLTAGAAADLLPGLTISEVEQAVVDTYRRHWELRPGTPGPLG